MACGRSKGAAMEQVAIGVVVTLVCILVSGLGFWAAEVVFTHHGRWLQRPPHSFKLFLVVTAGTPGTIWWS